MSNGREIEATMLDSETILLMLSMARNLPSADRPTGQDKPRNNPRPVATAFPPLHFNQIGQICPANAAMPAATCHPSCKRSPLVRRTGAIPLDTSIRKTARALNINTDAKFRFERGIDPNSIKEGLVNQCPRTISQQGNHCEMSLEDTQRLNK